MSIQPVSPSGHLYLALGLMSGTSLDGVDAALLRTDGESVVEPGPALTLPYMEELRVRLRGLLGTRRGERENEAAEAARDLTLVHVRAVEAVLKGNGIAAGKVDVIGFHGHTLTHRPGEGETYQIGDGGLLAQRLRINIVDDFRSRDVAEGGEGAPLAPVFHAALAGTSSADAGGDAVAGKLPAVVLNLGGVANVTWIGVKTGPGGDHEPPIAFDCGPGNALLDDWTRQRTGRPCDCDGALAAAGRVERRILSDLIGHPYFDRPPPKSLDRNDFDLSAVAGLSPADGAATLTAFTAHAVARAVRHFPARPRRWLVSGGGRHNPSLMAALREALSAREEEGENVEVAAVEDAGWDGDALEAHAFAYLAVRSLKNLPLSYPTTTGVRRPLSGGTLHRWRKGGDGM